MKTFISEEYNDKYNQDKDILNLENVGENKYVLKMKWNYLFENSAYDIIKLIIYIFS